MKLSVIIAISENNIIGKGDQLPWHLSADLKRFKAITMGHPMIMGRKTHESIGKVLPGRINIIITHNKNYSVEGAIVVHSIEDAIQVAQQHDQEEAFVIGGAAIIKEGLRYCNKIYLTKVLAEVEGNVVLDLSLSDDWKIVNTENLLKDEKNEYDAIFLDLEKS
jgi:dihydrofolate reductase